MALSKSVLNGLAESTKEFLAAFNAHDGDRISRVYTVDTKLMPTGMPAVLGRAGVKATFEWLWSTGVDSMEGETVEVGPLGAGDNENPTAIYDYVLWTMKLKDGSIADQGKYIALWRLVDNKWECFIDIFNSNLPAKK